ncbi:MAG: aminopeptidase P N-terminal domain-containing protein [Bdellovibrionales bacterium]
MTNFQFSKNSIAERLKRSSEKLSGLIQDSEAFIIRSGQPITKPGGLDQTYNFIPHPTYYWLTGSRRPHQAALYSKKTGWVHFYSPVSQEEKIWEGALDEMLLTSQNQTIQNLNKFIKDEGLQIATFDRDFLLKNAVDQVRRIKDQQEIALVEQLAQMALAGYQKISSLIRPGITEKEIQLEYELAVMRAGADSMPYESIVGSGTNSAILHAIPTHKRVQADDLILIDAGAAVQDYCVDITRIFTASGKMTSQQKDLYDLVLQSQIECIKICRPGLAWNQVHEKAARIIAQGLIDWKLFNGSVDSCLETEAISLFFPHGVGHLVGLRVRDTGHEENLNPKKYFGARLRVDLKMEENMLLTVEPGCYFIKELLHHPSNQEKYKSSVNFSEVDKWLNVGGVRIEDDILITSSGPRNLTAVVPY